TCAARNTGRQTCAAKPKDKNRSKSEITRPLRWRVAAVRSGPSARPEDPAVTRLWLAVLLVGFAFVTKTPGADAPKPDYSRGEKLLDGYFKAQVKDISDHCLTDLTTKEAWEKKRPELRRQFLEMLGVWPMPPKTDLKVTVTGKVEADAFTVEKLHFQSMPGLYVTANLYVPKANPDRKVGGASKFPTILYVCGHGNVVENRVS